MREGRLLAEESPAQLLRLFRTDSLEEVFLILSKRQEEGKLTNVEFERVADDDNNCVMPSVNTSTTSIPMSELGHSSTTVSNKIDVNFSAKMLNLKLTPSPKLKISFTGNLFL